MKIGAIVWNMDDFSEAHIDKWIAQMSMSLDRLNIGIEDTKYLLPNSNQRDPRECIDWFKENNYDWVLLLTDVFYVFENQNLDMLLQSQQSKVTYIAEGNHSMDIDDYGQAPIAINLHAEYTKEFFIFSRPLSNINEGKIKTFEFNSYGLCHFSGQMLEHDDVIQDYMANDEHETLLDAAFAAGKIDWYYDNVVVDEDVMQLIREDYNA